MGVYGPGGSLGLQNRAGRFTATGRFDSYTLPPTQNIPAAVGSLKAAWPKFPGAYLP